MTGKVNSENDVQGVGPSLLARREALGLTLDEVARVTRISKSYLDAIEHEAFDRLPSTAYCKGFIRIYAAHLNLSADDMVARFEGTLGQTSPQKPTPAGRQVIKDVSTPDGRPKRKWFLPLILLAVLIAISLLTDSDNRPPVVRPEKQQQVPVAQPPPVMTPVSSALPSSPKSATPDSVVKSPVPQQMLPPSETTGKGIVLRFKVNQESWLNIDLDGRFSQQYDLKAGDVIEWKADNIITVDLGNAGGVDAELNGKSLPPLGTSGKKAHVVVKPEGISSN